MSENGTPVSKRFDCWKSMTTTIFENEMHASRRFDWRKSMLSNTSDQNIDPSTDMRIEYKKCAKSDGSGNFDGVMNLGRMGRNATRQ